MNPEKPERSCLDKEQKIFELFLRKFINSLARRERNKRYDKKSIIYSWIKFAAVTQKHDSLLGSTNLPNVLEVIAGLTNQEYDPNIISRAERFFSSFLSLSQPMHSPIYRFMSKPVDRALAISFCNRMLDGVNHLSESRKHFSPTQSSTKNIPA